MSWKYWHKNSYKYAEVVAKTLKKTQIKSRKPEVNAESGFALNSWKHPGSKVTHQTTRKWTFGSWIVPPPPAGTPPAWMLNGKKKKNSETAEAEAALSEINRDVLTFVARTRAADVLARGRDRQEGMLTPSQRLISEHHQNAGIREARLSRSCSVSLAGFV